MYNSYVELTIYSATTAGHNYKGLYDCKWDPITLMNNIFYTQTLKFL